MGIFIQVRGRGILGTSLCGASPKLALREFTESIYSDEKKMNRGGRPN
jgi:hypothetical protein